MKVGILTYHWIYNYGAQLQALATAETIRSLGHEPVILHYIHTDLREGFYEKMVPPIQQRAHIEFTEHHLPTTQTCHSEEELIQQVDSLDLRHILVGSDAVFFIKYPRSPFSDTRYPSVFWLRWIERCKNYPDIQVSSLSASSMETNFRRLPKEIRSGLKHSLDNFSHVTVRDRWTYWFIKRVAMNRRVKTTPDPVMGFEENVGKRHFQDIDLPVKGKYILYGLQKGIGKERRELMKAIKEKVNKAGYKFISLPFPDGSYNEMDDETIHDPVNPLLWYKLIQHASGLFSEKFHPIVVSMHNKVPFVAIDGYSDRISRKFVVPVHMKIQSKTYDLCRRNGFRDAHIPVSQFDMSKVDQVVDTLLHKKWDFSISEKRSAEFTQTIANLLE